MITGRMNLDQDIIVDRDPLQVITGDIMLNQGMTPEQHRHHYPITRHSSALGNNDPREGPPSHYYSTHSSVPRVDPRPKPLALPYYDSHSTAPRNDPKQRSPNAYSRGRRHSPPPDY